MSDQGKSSAMGGESAAVPEKGKGKATDQPQDMSMDEDNDSSDTEAEEEVCSLRLCSRRSMCQPD